MRFAGIRRGLFWHRDGHHVTINTALFGTYGRIYESVAKPSPRSSLTAEHTEGSITFGNSAYSVYSVVLLRQDGSAHDGGEDESDDGCAIHMNTDFSYL